jgi:hypothetical protein
MATACQQLAEYNNHVLSFSKHDNLGDQGAEEQVQVTATFWAPHTLQMHNM